MALKFVPFSSQLDLPFYSAFFQSKLEHDKLDDSARSLVGVYEPNPEADPNQSAKMQIHASALTSKNVPLTMVRAEGFIKNFNTQEGLLQFDKVAMLQTAGKQIWDAIKDGTIYEIPSLLASFHIVSYADLKKYRFTYWFAFPTLHSDPQWKRVGDIGRLKQAESATLYEEVATWRYATDNRQHGFFLTKRVPCSEDDTDDVRNVGFKWAVGKLRDFESGFFDDVDEADRYVAFVDSSTFADHPSWPLRNLLVLIRQRYHLNKVQILCYRDTKMTRDKSKSIILPLAMDKVEEMETAALPRVTGWERDANQKFSFRSVNLGENMDPQRLADQAVDLNLKLMKWRISPNLNLDILKDLSCLLLGAGTLGSYVSRNLMGWGVKRITFVDYGSVSFSNPVRQPLYEYKDCLHGGAPKAAQAAKALERIYPGVHTDGHHLSVPMLGHAMTDEAKTKADFEALEALIESHDVIFLLMDSRESRWLPTVMGKASGKIVMNAALGFDTYVVMRHGADTGDDEVETLGCYFCNDVVAPADSMKDQTLDQQCTVTRPGVAAIASALLVELLVSMLQHPLQQWAPAPVLNAHGTYDREPEDHALGIVPHQIRGFLANFQNMIIHGKSYPNCSACSRPILDTYKKNGWDFVKKALNDRDYVTELSGLAEIQRLAEQMAAEMDLSDEDDEFDADDAEPVLI